MPENIYFSVILLSCRHPARHSRHTTHPNRNLITTIFFIYHRLNVVFWLGKTALTKQFAHVLYCHITFSVLFNRLCVLNYTYVLDRSIYDQTSFRYTQYT